MADKKKAPPTKDRTPAKGKTSEAAAADTLKADPGAQAAEKPAGKMAGCVKFCCNKEEGSCMGRTGLSWLKIAIFYIIFYLGLFAFFTVLLLIVLNSFEANVPRRKLDESLIGNPGLGYRPSNKNRDSALIWFSTQDPDSYKNYVKELANMTDADKDRNAYVHCHGINSTLKDCEKAKGTDKMPNVYNDDENLGEDIKYEWGDCTNKTDFGYKDGKPCVLIRLNRIIGWEPGPMPDHVPYFYENIAVPKQGNETTNGPEVYLSKNNKMVCIYCEGENPFDKQMLGKVEYYPGGHRPGSCIPSFFFPFENQKNYLSPFIFVHFPEIPVATLIQVRCTAYNKNIKPDPHVGVGMVRFELLVDTKATIKKS